jgi:hypothetical protein
MADALFEGDILERMVRAVEKVRDRLLGATRALEEANIPYADHLTTPFEYSGRATQPQQCMRTFKPHMLLAGNRWSPAVPESEHRTVFLNLLICHEPTFRRQAIMR